MVDQTAIAEVRDPTMRELSTVAEFLRARLIVVPQYETCRGTQRIPISVIPAFTRQW